MSKNNIKLLNDSQKQDLKNRFDFVIEDAGILVVNKYYNRNTLHPYGKSFFINADVRKITFTAECMDYYVEFNKKFPYKNYNLIDIQQAINILFLLYQPITEEGIIKVLEKGIKPLLKI